MSHSITIIEFKEDVCIDERTRVENLTAFLSPGTRIFSRRGPRRSQSSRANDFYLALIDENCLQQELKPMVTL